MKTQHHKLTKTIELRNVHQNDLETLIQIRIDAMKTSLMQIGRYDPERVRVRLIDDFIPDNTKYIYSKNVIAGFFATTENDFEIKLNHLYIKPEFQGQGIGKIVLIELFRIADITQKHVILCALKQSPANQFYTSNGFEFVREESWDNYYIRKCKGNA